MITTWNKKLVILPDRRGHVSTSKDRDKDHMVVLPDRGKVIFSYNNSTVHSTT